MRKLLAFGPTHAHSIAEEITLAFLQDNNIQKLPSGIVKAAEQGDALAQAILGMMYAEGKGVRQDDKKAAEWYRKAAEQGEARAQGYIRLDVSQKEKALSRIIRKLPSGIVKQAEQGYLKSCGAI